MVLSDGNIGRRLGNAGHFAHEGETLNRSFRNFAANCRWCLEAQALDYDEYFSLAGKKFVEDETGNEDLLSFDEYMNQLTDLEVDLLYTAYYQDFLLFGYDAWE